MIFPNWIRIPQFKLDPVEKIISGVVGLIAIGEAVRRLVRRHRRKAKPPELRRFSFMEYIDFQHRRTSKPALFRFAGPVAADFERGYVYSRPEVNTILDRLIDEVLIGVVGSPAAGKTVVLRLLGYEMVKNHRYKWPKKSAVYMIPLKEKTITELELEKLRRLDKSAVILVDDCHLDRKFTEQLIAAPAPNCRIILFSRPLNFPPVTREASRNLSIPDLQLVDGGGIHASQVSPLKAAFDVSKAVEIKATDAASEIVSLYFDRNGLVVDKDAHLRIISSYGANLMILTWALDTFQRNKAFTPSDVSRTAANWLLPEFDSGDGFYRDMRRDDWPKIHPDQAALVFLALASPYRYEFPVTRSFFEDDLKVERSHIDLLVKSRMVTVDQNEIGLPHSSLATLFVDAASAGFLTEVASIIEQRLQMAFPDGVLRSYVGRRPNDTCRLLSVISRWSTGSALAIESIVASNERVVRQSISAERNLSVIASALHGVKWASEITARNILEGDAAIVDILGKKLREAPVGWESAECVVAIAAISKSCAMELIPSIKTQIGAVSLDGKLGNYIHSIASQSEDVAAALLPALSEKVRDGQLGWEMGSFISEVAGYVDLNGAGKRMACELMKGFPDKILKASGYAPIVFGVSAIAGFPGEHFLDLSLELAPSIGQRLNAEPTRVLVGTVVAMIAADDQPLAKAIYGYLSPEAKDIIKDIILNPPTEEVREAFQKAGLL